MQSMFAIMGVTGQVGGAAAEHLLRTGHAVRAIVRDAAKAAPWTARGASAAVADWTDAEALAQAFAGAESVFVMLPADFAPEPGFPAVRQLLQVLVEALRRAEVGRVVALSSVGAQHEHGLGLITQLHLLEQALDALPVPRAYLRAAWFMENLQWAVAEAASSGCYASHLQPLDRAIPMIATCDIGRVVAQTLRERWQGRRVIELEARRRYTPRQMAQALARVSGRQVEAVAVPRDEWVTRFAHEGTPAPRSAARVEMLDGFNSGWIDFEGVNAEHVRGDTTLEAAVDALAQRRNPM